MSEDRSAPTGASRRSDGVVARAKEGDEAAFAHLVRSHRDRTLSTAWRLLGDREDAADAAQEAFLRAHRYLQAFDESQDFGAWLHAIVVNVCRSLARRKRGGLHVSTEALGEPAAGGESSDPMIDLQDSSAHLARGLATLTERERLALVLRDLEGLPTEEVARRLGVTVTTVRAHICMARKKLHRFCAAESGRDDGGKP